MKPSPFWALNHFTVPIAIAVPSKNENYRRPEASDGSNFSTVRGAGPALYRALGRASRTTGESTLTNIGSSGSPYNSGGPQGLGDTGSSGWVIGLAVGLPRRSQCSGVDAVALNDGAHQRVAE